MTADSRVPLEPNPADSRAGINSARAAALPPIPEPSRTFSTVDLWMQRLAVSMFAVLCAALGIFLVFLPWSLAWTDNPLLHNFPGLRTFLGYGFVRGVFSGVGLLDLWIGFREAIHYYENPGPGR